MTPPEFSDYIVYVDESGHASPEVDPYFPCFVLAFCLFAKEDYTRQVTPSLQRFKFQFFGHDMVVLHEREIRKAHGDFSILKNSKLREQFHHELTRLIANARFTIISETIRKDGLHLPEDNLYHLAAKSCLEALYTKMLELEQSEKVVHVVFEKRGKNEDRELELEFRRICARENKHGAEYLCEPIFASKQCISTGLQFADLFARPIGLSVLRPEQENRAFEILKNKTLTLESNLTQSEFEIP